MPTELPSDRAGDAPESSPATSGNPQARCPKCGTPKAPEAAGGLCPQCLMGVGLGTQPEVTGEEKGGARTPPPSPESLAARFPQLEILEVIGQGGMGVVYRARQRKLDRTVALKLLAPEAAKDPSFAERFTREARALARLNHPNILTVYDFGESEGLFYLVMEYVDGADLRRVLQQGKLGPQEALRIVPILCDALQYAHAQGVVHRDIKPGNILIDREGRVKIADFGIAKLAGSAAGDVTLTQSKQSMGTPHYMAPEQVESPQTVDHRADIYSLGVVFYEMLTGELPIGRFAPPSRRVEVDVRVDEVVLRALEKEPSRRYQQAGEVKTEVERLKASPASAPAASGPPRLEPPRELAAGRSSGGAGPWITAGWLWALLFPMTLYVARFPRFALEGGEASVRWPSETLMLLAFLGALAPLGMTGFGWMALWAADRTKAGSGVLRRALLLMWISSAVGLAYLGVAIGMSVQCEMLGFQPGPVPFGVSLVGSVLGVGWLAYRLSRGCLQILGQERGQRPGWFSWATGVPVGLALVVSVLLVQGVRAKGVRIHEAVTPTLASLLGAASSMRPAGEVTPVEGAALEIPLLGQRSTPAPVTLQASLPHTWSMTPQGPAFEGWFLNRLVPANDVTKRAALNAALQGAWSEYRDALARNLERTTNAAGRVVIEVRPMPQELDAIANRFWTAADGLLGSGGQALMRREFVPQFRPRWTGVTPGQGAYDSTWALLRYGDLRFRLEYGREGTWYVHRSIAGDFMNNTMDRSPFHRNPALPEDLQLLEELTATTGSGR